MTLGEPASHLYHSRELIAWTTVVLTIVVKTINMHTDEDSWVRQEQAPRQLS